MRLLAPSHIAHLPKHSPTSDWSRKLPRFADKFREVLLPTGMCQDGIQPMEVAKLASRWAVATAKVEEGGVDSFNERSAGSSAAALQTTILKFSTQWVESCKQDSSPGIPC